jgi:hypothetical protein
LPTLWQSDASDEIWNGLLPKGVHAWEYASQSTGGPAMKRFEYTAELAKIIFGQPMNGCPKCGSYELRYQTPIKLDLDGTETASQIIGKWARATKKTGGILVGPVFLMCVKCGHNGPAVDCTGRTSEDVGRDPKIAAEVKRLWNEQHDLR